jgi:hypothetical protein
MRMNGRRRGPRDLSAGFGETPVAYADFSAMEAVVRKLGCSDAHISDIGAQLGIAGTAVVKVTI